MIYVIKSLLIIGIAGLISACINLLLYPIFNNTQLYPSESFEHVLYFGCFFSIAAGIEYMLLYFNMKQIKPAPSWLKGILCILITTLTGCIFPLSFVGLTFHGILSLIVIFGLPNFIIPYLAKWFRITER